MPAITLAEFQSITSQTAFDASVRHLFSMREPARLYETLCGYRTSGGGMCAVGVLIPDELYLPRMDRGDSSPVATLIATNINTLQPLVGCLPVLEGLQIVHDDGHHWGETGLNDAALCSLHMLALEHSLNTTVLDALVDERSQSV